MLIAEAYDYALLAGVEWLREQCDADISCCRISLASDATLNSEYLACSYVYPAPELLKLALPRSSRHSSRLTARWADWEAALSGVANDVVASCFQKELSEGCEANLPKRILRFRVAGKRRWTVSARKKNAYVWQQGRFDDDVQFWRTGLGDPGSVKPVKNGECLRFTLETAADFRFFLGCVRGELQAIAWRGGDELEEDSDPGQDSE